MSARYNYIQPLSFRLADEGSNWPVSYDRIALPGIYKQELLAAYNQKYPKRKLLPIKDLNQLVRLLVPDLITLDSYAGKLGDQTWLRVEPGAVDLGSIEILLSEWSHAYDIGSVALPDRSKLRWQEETIDLAGWETHEPGGTAKASISAVYDVLPAFLAKDIEGLAIDLGGPNLLTFYRVAKSPNGKGHEMMSWPPLCYTDGRGHPWYYSYHLHIVVATIPFDSRPVVNIYLGVRRWASAHHFIPRNEKVSIYLRAGVSYIKGVRSTHSFQVASAKLMGGTLEWVDKLPTMLQNVGFGHDIPSPQMLWDDPTVPLSRVQMPNMAMVFNTRMSSPNHAVNPGVTPHDRSKLLNVLAERWKQWLTVASMLPEAKVSVSRNERAFSNPKISDQTAKRWARIKQQHRNAEIRIELYYQREASRQAMLDALAELMSIDASEGEYIHDQVKLTVFTRPLGDLGAALDRSANDSLQQIMDQRRDKVMAALELATTPTIALIELGDKDAFPAFHARNDKALSTDPKKAIRYAFAHTGRLTQFFTPMTDLDITNIHAEMTETVPTDGKKLATGPNISDRLKNAALDGLRQLGVHEGGEARERQRWELNQWGYAVAGYWIIRQSHKVSLTGNKQFLPALVYINHTDGRVLAWVAGMKDMLPYHEVLLRAGRGKIDFSLTLQEIAIRLPQDLETWLGSNEGVVLVIDATQSSMRNQVWKWLQDSKIVMDKADFSDGRRWLPEDMRGLRIVRVRSDKHEVPTWYAQNDAQAGISKGLWRVGNRVFGSTTGTPTTQQYKRSITKTDSSSAAMNTPNPTFYELTTAFLQKGDNPAEIAHMIHSLREASIQSRDETAHALPLHLAKRIEEYLLLPDDDNEVSEDESNEAEL